MKICIVAGARPNFMKIAPIIEEIKKVNSIKNKIDYYLVHTGQHYDEKMSEFFFNNLGLPQPNINLEVGSLSHSAQTAEIMKRFEQVCMEIKPTHVLVVGDVNSTIACALVAAKLGIKIIHVEAGLRSFDRGMPEEINRVLTDTISDYLFTTEESANQNLINEGIPEEKIHFVGNVMIDALLKHRARASQTNLLGRLGVSKPNLEQLNQPLPSIAPIMSSDAVKPYAVLTLHRPSNVDDRQILQGILEAVSVVGEKLPIVFPIHPRTYNQIKKFKLEKFFNWKVYNSTKENIKENSINVIEPLGYLDFLNLMSNSKLVLTDSGGIQEETTILKISCVTIRENTERPVTVTHGTNIISGINKDRIVESALSQLRRNDSGSGEDEMQSSLKYHAPPLWDGQSAIRIVEVLLNSRCRVDN